MLLVQAPRWAVRRFHQLHATHYHRHEVSDPLPPVIGQYVAPLGGETQSTTPGEEALDPAKASKSVSVISLRSLQVCQPARRRCGWSRTPTPSTRSNPTRRAPISLSRRVPCCDQTCVPNTRGCFSES